jgi:hypothetical protein
VGNKGVEVEFRYRRQIEELISANVIRFLFKNEVTSLRSRQSFVTGGAAGFNQWDVTKSQVGTIYNLLWI